MTDSLDRKPRDNSREAIFARIGDAAKRDIKEIEEFADLPTWVRAAAGFKYLTGMTWKEVAAKFGKSERTIDRYKIAPAFKAWRDELQEISLDPRRTAELIFDASAAGLSIEYMAALHKAIEVGDYKEVGIIIRDMLDRAGVHKKQAKQEQPSINITIAGGSSIKAPILDAEYEMVNSEAKQLPPGDE